MNASHLLPPQNKRVLPLFFSLVTLLLTFFTANAAHLVGGEMSYVCQGGNVYEVTLRVYRDCASGGAAFDANLSIVAYDINNNIINTVNVAKGPTISISPNPGSDPCLTVPANLCSEYADYVTTMSLPPLNGGYTLVTQRCCRNNTITNVTNSGSYGSTWTVSIPSLDMDCNSSPTITTVAPTLICLGEDINLALSAAETDGDSLFYELCDVYSGGGQGGGGCNAVVPNPPCPPPFTIVPWALGYSATNPIPATPAISINPNTGLISGVPNQIGQYLVGVCVSEYRNGQLLSTSRLDYQFNVTNCGRPISDMVTPIEDPTIMCGGLTVKFYSQSANNTSILWDFGDPTSTTDTSSNPNAVYTYPNDAIYLVSLIANPGQPCTDTTQFLFDVKKLVDVTLAFTGVACFEVQGFEFEPVGYWQTGTTFTWFISPGANISTWSGTKTPPITWNMPGVHSVELMMAWQPSCADTLVQLLTVSSLTLLVDAGPDQYIDQGDKAYLNAFGGDFYFWYADLPAYFSNQFTANPQTLPLHDTTVYYVEVTDRYGCKGLDSMTIYLNPQPLKPNVMNVITPNGDGRNDWLNLLNLTGDDACRFTVLNRWGAEVYTQEVYDNTWSGYSNGGQDLPDGTYYFILQKKDEVIFKGPVTIMRNE